jgi:hypothetical protein
MGADNAERDTLIANLETMGKICNGDLLVEADERGLLRRKTNFLTQWKESEKIGTENLFVQITVVLTRAAQRIDDGDTELSKRFTAACSGLDTLMSTYRSKGSKGTKSVDCLMAVLTPFHSRLHAEQALDNSVTDLKTLAEKAVKFLTNARIASTNSTFSASYFGKDQDDWLLWLLVRAATVHGCADKHKELRKKVKELMRNSEQSRDQKRTDLETWLRDNFDNDGTRRRSINTFMREFWVDQVRPAIIPGKGPLGVDWKLWSEDLDDDLESRETFRIRLVRKAMKSRLGNCGEKACIVATHLVEATHPHAWQTLRFAR